MGQEQSGSPHYGPESGQDPEYVTDGRSADQIPDADQIPETSPDGPTGGGGSTDEGSPGTGANSDLHGAAREVAENASGPGPAETPGA